MAWACVQTYGASERKAVFNLRRQGFEAFCPFYKKPAHLVKKHGAKDAPLFPCYAFVELVDYRRWSPINSTFGVIRLLTNRNVDDPKPLWVEDDYIASLLKLTDDSQDDLLPPDTVVQIKRADSAFYEKIGRVVEMDRNQRLIVLMHLFNRDIKVMFDSADGIEVLAYPEGYKDPHEVKGPDQTKVSNGSNG